MVLWFQGAYVGNLIRLSCELPRDTCITPASPHDSKACEELLEDTNFPMILADLGYISQSLKQRLAQKGYSFGHRYVKT